MLMDPFRPGGMGSTGGQGFGPPPHPGQLPRFVTSGDLSITSKFILHCKCMSRDMGKMYR